MPHPEFDDSPPTRLTGGGITLPVSLYTAMAACYYGSGPRHHQSPLAAHRETAVIPSHPTAHPPEGGELVAPVGILSADELRGFIPRGSAAKPKVPLKPPGPAETPNAQ